MAGHTLKSKEEYEWYGKGFLIETSENTTKQHQIDILKLLIKVDL